MKTTSHDRSLMGLRRLVCGYSEPKRSRKFLLMLAHIDASGTMEDSPFYVMAGYLAPVASWEAFTREWQAGLDEPNPKPLAYFKMKEAFRLQDQFRGWSEEERNDRLKLLCKVINRHATAMVIFIVSTDAWKRHFVGELDNRYHDRPYYFAFHGVMSSLARYLESKGIDEKVHFVFDDEGGEPTAMIANGYDDYVANAPDQFRKYLGSRPRFEKDHEILPLQAADMAAWHVRRVFAEGNGIDVSQPTVITVDLLTGVERLQSKWGEKEVKDAIDFIKSRSLALTLNKVEATPITIRSDPLGPWWKL